MLSMPRTASKEKKISLTMSELDAFQCCGTKYNRRLSFVLSETMNEMFGELFLPCEMPEPPKQGFFQSLFGNTSNLDREELCKFSAHLQWSWPAPATLAGNKIWSTSTMAPAYTSIVYSVSRQVASNTLSVLWWKNRIVFCHRLVYD